MTVQELIFFLSYNENLTDQVLIYDKFNETYKNIDQICLDDDTVVIFTT